MTDPEISTTGAASLSALLEETYGLSDAEVDKIRSEYLLGRTAMLLHRRGKSHAAALLLDVDSASLDAHYAGDYDPWGTSEVGVRWEEAVLDVEPYMVERFTAERTHEILDALQAVTEREGMNIQTVRVRETVPDVGEGWRDALSAELASERASNAARKVRLAPAHPTEDGLDFTNLWEHKVYRVLREKQLSLPPDQTLGILPLPAFRSAASTLEPDFLVTYGGRAGVLEVDGPHHGQPGRRSNDASRDALLTNAGVAWVDRIDVRDATSKEEVGIFVDRFLRRMTERS